MCWASSSSWASPTSSSTASPDAPPPPFPSSPGSVAPDLIWGPNPTLRAGPTPRTTRRRRSQNDSTPLPAPLFPVIPAPTSVVPAPHSVIPALAAGISARAGPSPGVPANAVRRTTRRHFPHPSSPSYPPPPPSYPRLPRVSRRARDQAPECPRTPFARRLDATSRTPLPRHTRPHLRHTRACRGYLDARGTNPHPRGPSPQT